MDWTESIEWFIEGHAFLRSYDLASRPRLPPSPVSKLSLFLCLPVCRQSSSLTVREGGRGWGRSQIIQPRESLVLDKSRNTLRTGAKYKFMWWHRCKCLPWRGDLDKRFSGSSAWEGDKTLPASSQYRSRKPTQPAYGWSSRELYRQRWAGI